MCVGEALCKGWQPRLAHCFSLWACVCDPCGRNCNTHTQTWMRTYLSVYSFTDKWGGVWRGCAVWVLVRGCVWVGWGVCVCGCLCSWFNKRYSTVLETQHHCWPTLPHIISLRSCPACDPASIWTALDKRETKLYIGFLYLYIDVSYYCWFWYYGHKGDNQAAGTLCGIVSVTSPRSCDSWDESWHEPLADEWAKRSGARAAPRADGNSINQSRSWSSHPPSQTVLPQGASVLISNTSVISFSVCVFFGLFT